MYFSKETATKIINEISIILDYDINIMDDKGAILASTDPSRVGEFHEGAFLIINHRLSELIVYFDQEYYGCKKGINLPICLEEKIIGVIGITGEVEEVKKYGIILKKMTEILCLNLFSYHKKSRQEQALMVFVHEWLNKTPYEHRRTFFDTLHSLGFSEKDHYIAALVAPPDVLDNLPDHAAGTEEQREIHTKIEDYGIVIFNTDKLQAVTGFLQNLMRHSEAGCVTCAVGSCHRGYSMVKQSFDQAYKLLMMKRGNGGIFHYRDYIYDFILDDVPFEYRDMLISQTLAELNPAEQKELAGFMEVYIRNNGSINKIAEELFVHKNTVQYKINNIRRKTGLDPRVVKDAFLLMLVSRWV